MKAKAKRASAFAWTAILAVFFLGVYGSINWLTSLRPDVGQFYFAWEKQIPYVPAMIIPYMSIDLLFLGAAFFCRDREQLHTFVARTLFAIGISAIFFLLFPLHFCFDRPPAHSLLARGAELFKSFDRPYNLAPSLHISLRTILMAVYVPRFRGTKRTLLAVWFGLVGVSTLLLYQHHVVDVLAGDAVALCCLYLFPERDGTKLSLAACRNIRVGRWYGMGSITLLLLALLGGAFLLLVWPAISLALMAWAYFTGNPAVFQKDEGQISTAARIILAPYLLGAWLSFLWFSRDSVPCTRITDRVFLGRKVSAREARRLVESGVVAVVDLTAEFVETKALRSLHYLNIPVLDLTPPSAADIQRALEFIRHETVHGKVYVHCALGCSRSATVIAAHLLAEGIADNVETSIRMIKARRPQVVITPTAMAFLREPQPAAAAHSWTGTPVLPLA